MTHAEIVNKVKSILNEHGEVDAVNIDEDRVLLEDYIESAIPDAVIMLAQKGYRVNVYNDNPAMQGGKVVIPDGFISLLYIKFEDWRKAVTKITEVGSPEYNVAMNYYTQPGINSPMCYRQGDFLVCLPNGSIEGMEYNAKYDPSVVNGALDADYKLKAETKEATAVCYMAAALVLGMFGDDTGKQRLSDVATNMLS